MDESYITPRTLIAEVRGLLEQQGDVGALLLAKIDNVLASGFEDEDMHQPDMFERTGQRAFIIRAPKDEWEVLSTHLDVLKAYMVDLPACLSSAQTELQERFDISEGVLSFRSDLTSDITFRRESGDYYFSNIIPEGWNEARWLFDSIYRLIDEARKQGER